MQVVGYGTPAGALFVSGGDPERSGGSPGDGGAPVDRIALDPGTELAWRLGERRCAGTVTEDGHLACGNEDAPYCDAHSSTWVCARCSGNCSKPVDNCDLEHVVYVAAFAPDVFKVGVTKPGRLDRRLREQGADRAVRLLTVEDGRIARRIEAAISASGLERTPEAGADGGVPSSGIDVPDADGLPERVRVPTKIAGLGAAVDGDAWAALLDGVDYEESFAFDYGLDLAGRPVSETLLSGTVVGTKGRLLVLENAGTTYAVDLRDLVGHELREGGNDRELQSSLGAFG